MQRQRRQPEDCGRQQGGRGSLRRGRTNPATGALPLKGATALGECGRTAGQPHAIASLRPRRRLAPRHSVPTVSVSRARCELPRGEIRDPSKGDGAPHFSPGPATPLSTSATCSLRSPSATTRRCTHRQRPAYSRTPSVGARRCRSGASTAHGRGRSGRGSVLEPMMPNGSAASAQRMATASTSTRRSGSQSDATPTSVFAVTGYGSPNTSFAAAISSSSASQL